MITGLRADLMVDLESQLQQRHLASWMTKWPRLTITNELFVVSSLVSTQSVQHLFEVVEAKCTQIFDAHALRIPAQYCTMLEAIRSVPDDQALLHEDELMGKYFSNLNHATALRILRYFHSIGRIVYTKGGLVFTNPQLAPKIAAIFVSPMDVRVSLLKKKDANVQILSTEDVGCLLATNNSERYCVVCVILLS